VHRNRYGGKIGVLAAAPEEGLGVPDPESRQTVGEDKLTVFRRFD
jgi:crotonyl-CoA reductase